MKITGIEAYQAELRYAGKAYSFSHGRKYTTFITTVVALQTDSGHVGYGEVCPCGPAYMPAYAEGFLPALEQLAPLLIGEDPTQTTRILRLMDSALNGHEFAKTPIDLACWDLLGKVAGLPVYALLGGELVPRVPLHRVVPLASIAETLEILEQLRDQGFRSFQVKLGGNIDQDVERMKAIDASRRVGEILVGDINTSWRQDQVMRASRMLSDVDFYIEQPCREYDENRALNGKIIHPLKLDENLTSVGEVRRAIEDHAMQAAAIKLSRYGGLTRSRIIRDMCADAGIALTIEEAWGSGIASAASAHLAVSTPPETLLNGTDIHNYNSNQIATGQPKVNNGFMTLSDKPGLGVEPLFEALGKPVFQI